MSKPQPLDLWHILKIRRNTVAQWCESEGISNVEDFLLYCKKMEGSSHYYISEEMVSVVKEYISTPKISPLIQEQTELEAEQLAVMTKQELPKKRVRKTSLQDNADVVSSPTDDDDPKEESSDKS